MSRTPYVGSAAILSGWVAWAVGRMLPPAEVALRLEASGVTGELAAQVLAAADAIRRAGDEWHQRASAHGPPEAVDAEPVASSTVVDTSQAARRLGLSTRRVRQLCCEARLPALRVGAVWAIETAALDAYIEQRHRD